ncbi:GntR family transcriptional regulator [Streptomyces sp. NPDC001443]
MEQSTQGSTGPQVAPQARLGEMRVPVQPRAADRDRIRQEPPDGAARGEHTHAEPPMPRPHTAVAGPTSSHAAVQRTAVPHLGDLESTATRPVGTRPAVPHPAVERPSVQRSSVRGQIVDALRTALVAGELTPGEVYSAPALAERFGVSATPVREAMQQLALEGAVEVVPNRGFRVIERDARELAELAEVRGLVEVPVMLRLARAVAPERWAELRPLAEATVRAASTGCPATYAESDRAFHRAVLSLAGNAQLVRIAEDLHRRAQWPLVGGAARQRRAELVADASEHLSLLEALIDQDLDVVRSLLREHFTGTA